MKNIDYLYKRVLELDELYTKITIITGFTAEQLLDLFERGFVLIGQDDIKENEALRKNEEVMRQNWYKASKTVQQQREELDRREKTIKELEKGVEELCSKNSMLEKMQPLQMDGEAARSLILAMELAEAKAELEQEKRERLNQDKGCEYCLDDNCPPLDWKYGLDHIFPDYGFCPMCGRKLKGEDND